MTPDPYRSPGPLARYRDDVRANFRRRWYAREGCDPGAYENEGGNVGPDEETLTRWRAAADWRRENLDA